MKRTGRSIMVPGRGRLRPRRWRASSRLLPVLWLLASALACAGAEPECAADSAFAMRASDVRVQCSGQVVRVLPDDTRGSRHQRFVVRIGPRQTVLVSHNIDLAPRVEGLEVGDRVTFRGEYEWNERGGVVHWTHDDPRGRHPGGWIEHAGERYR